ncbi:mannan-binding lectin serine protease 2-like [Tachysurus fulvidraco]|uniref:mannan-binding lectin serine protease 2-like n=1 Tax=Tachysurus fulvidraco TaxID=1234273 RepID=UPI000F4E3A4D|nr:mannan-binding lectin serine protease 2-like [Tachysurus fulvidraco]
MIILSVCVLLLPLVCSQPQGWLSSPDHPLAYPSNSTKNWTLCASPGFAVSLTLIHLDLENSAECEHDALKIFTGNNLNKTLCGSMSFTEMESSINPHLHSASGGCLYIYFHSDDSHPQVHTGFNAFYQTQDVDECASKSNPCSHFCYNFIGGFRCSCPHGYLLNHNKVTCEAIKCGNPKTLLNGHVEFVKGSNNEYLSVIEYHCNKPYYTSKGKHYGNYTCSAAQIWKENGNDILPSCHYVCGQQKLMSQYSRIIGGKPAPSGSFPWQVYLYINPQRGGAFIIGETWLMTAAHNLVRDHVKGPINKENVQAYAGHNNLNEMEKYITLNISSIHVHENYTTGFDNDIALIKLKSPITFSENIRPVCLPPNTAEWKKYRGFVSGYGLIDVEMGKVADELMYVDIPTVDQLTCRKSFEKERSNDIPHVTDNMFCAGLSGGGMDSCSGDSGSAFVVRENDVYCALGIVSWGLKLCGSKGMYGVYTKVSQYLDWINKTMSEN